MSTPDDHRDILRRFCEAESLEQALAVVSGSPDDLLTDEALAELDRLIEAETDEARQQHLRERRELLASLKAMADQAQPLRQQIDSLPEDERRFLAFTNIPNSLGLAALVAETGDETLDELEATAEARLTEAEGNEARDIGARLVDLRQIRAAGREAAKQQVEDAQRAAEELGDRLVAWIQTDDWESSEAYLRQHAAELLTDRGESALDILQLANPGNEQILTHRTLLHYCREHGIDAAYAQLRRELQAAREAAENPLRRAVVEFLQTEDDEAARALLSSQGHLLLTLDARRAIEGFVEAARQQGDETTVTRIEARLGLWDEAWSAQVGGPLRRQGVDWAEQPESERVEILDSAALAAERAAQYVVVTARNSAIGPGASVLNIFNVGEIPLKWRTPEEKRSDLTRGAVGRQAELEELHRRLSKEGKTALVSKGTAPAMGTSAAVRGQPGIGKTVLAAMYANHYADHYRGGVLWLDIGPSKRTADSVTSDLQRIATYAYDADAQAQLLENCVFAAEVVKALLSRKEGRMLVVFDDVWSEDVVAELKAAVPDDSSIILTTRDYDVAFALEQGAGAIQSLDVLSEDDARELLQSKAPGLPNKLADRVAEGLGCHAQALTLAAGALARRKAHRYQQTADEILQRVAEGRGFGDLPRMDKAERVTEVEIALRYSYDYLGEGEAGNWRQAWFRALGVLAQEASFDPAAAAAIWQADQATADEFLLALDGLGLIQEVIDEAGGASGAGRWQQHAILRAYALSLQDEEERLALPERHADHYLDLARRCHEAKPRDDDRVEVEFKQIDHAFAWCRRFSPIRAVHLSSLLNDFMRNRGRAVQLGDWLRSSLDAAQTVGDRLGKANTLQSLGDLESRLGNIDAARQHYEDALKLYRLEREPGGIINTFAAAKWAWRKPTKRCTRRPMTPLLRPSLRCSRWTA